MGLPVPEETVLIVAGYLVWQGHLRLFIVLVVGVISAVVGDNLGYYWLGRRYGQTAVERVARWAAVDAEHMGSMRRFAAGGFLVKTVAKGSPGEAMGIKGGRKTATVDGQPLVVGGDIILSVEGIAVTTAADLAKIRERTSRLGEAAPVTVTVLRAGRQLKLSGKMP